jgi:cytochrome oxidase assembly protein ShyY1
VRSLAFLLTRRWVLLALVVVLLSTLAWQLGQWQFRRLEDRQERNATTLRNEGAEPVPVTDVLAVGRPVAPADEWRLVTATGDYAVDDTVIVRYRTRDGESGVDVVVPLVLPDGTAVLVDRGWLLSDNNATSTPDVPSPPPSPVTVTGWVRADADGDSTRVTDQSTRAISSVAISEALDRPLLGGFLDLTAEDPEPSTPLLAAEPPDLGNGPHFFYGLQWWFFALLAVGGYVYLAYDEWRRRRHPDRVRPTAAERLRRNP